MTALKWSLGTVVLIMASQNALAQQPIGAGGQIQQIPPAPVQQNSIPALPIPQQQAAPVPVAAGTKFAVNSLQVTGETRFSAAKLVAVSGFQPGQQFTLYDLQVMAAKITNYYNQRGYFVARAYLPPQDITNGVVTIAVIEGRYGQVSLRNLSLIHI